MNSDNPYAPPVEASVAWTEQSALDPDAPATRVPYVLGILSMIFSSVTFLTAGMTTIGFWAVRVFAAREGGDHIVALFLSGYSATISLMAVWLFVLGLGQLRFRRWARRQTIYWGIIGMGVVVGFPILCGILAGVGVNNKDMAGVAVVGVVGLIFLAPYPILLLVFFLRRRVKSAMR